MSRSNRILAITLAVLLLVIVGLFLLIFERRPAEVEIPPERAARLNDYLAAGMFLDRLGIPYRVVRNPVDTPSPSAVVVLPSTAAIDHEGLARWQTWAERGGLLILGLADDAPRREWLTSLGAKMVERSGNSETLEVGNLWDDQERFNVSIQAKLTLAPEAIDFVEDGYPAADHLPIARFATGEGALVVLADDSILTNQRLGEAQHGRFFWSLTTTALVPSEVVFVLRDQRPVLRQYLTKAWPLWTALLAWLGLYLWTNMARFGPLIEAPEPAQRGLREHLRAAAKFLWRRRETELLISATRRAAWRRAEAVLPGWAALSQRDRAKALAAAVRRKVEILPQQVDWVLESEPPVNDETFLQQVDLLEKVRRSL